MKLCILLIVLGVIATGPLSGPQSVSAHVAIVAQKLFAAIRKGDVAAVESEANAGNVNAIDDLGENSLHIAVDMHNVEIAEKLIEKGANVNHLSMSGKTPIQKAKANGDTEIVELLRKNGATESLSV